MKKFSSAKIPLILIVLTALVFAKLQANKQSGSKADVCINICSDGRGYYAWLPAIFIYHDLNFNFFDNVELKQAPCGGTVGGCLQDYRLSFDGRNCDKYYPGASFMMLPFFAGAHFFTKAFTSLPANGYSPPYFISIGLSGIFYYFLGMLFFLKALTKLKLSNAQKSLTILLVTFGTNILYYSVDKPSYSHIYSFTLIAAFVYYVLCLKDRFSIKYIVCISFLTGFIFIARPVNVSIIILLPFLLWKKRKEFYSYFINRPANFLYLAPGLIMPLILFALYKIATGHFFIYSYKDEGFNFLQPHLRAFMFGYDNGIFPYTPLLLLPFFFLFAWYKPEHKNLILGSAITLMITIYIHSSWWCWSYGFGFGARTMLDFAPLFGIIIGLSLKLTNPKKHFYLLPMYFLCCVLTMLLYNQKNHGFMNLSPITDYWNAVYNGLGIKA